MKWLKEQRMHIVVAFMFAIFGIPQTAGAVGPNINANIYDGHAASMVITAPLNNAVVSSSPITIEGTLHNIGQIMVYINDAYSMTYPIDTGATTFSFQASVDAGQYTMRLIGINPFDGTTLEETISFTYSPALTSGDTNPVGAVVGTAQATGEYMKDQVDQASSSAPGAIISDLGFQIMSALDLAPVVGGAESVAKMTARFVTVTSGLTLLVMTQPMVGAYHFIRYRFLEWNVHALPNILHHHATMALRIGGLTLLAIGFFI